MILVAAVLVVALAVWGVVREARSRSRHGWHRLAWRWLTGAAWHGQPVAGDTWQWPGPWFWRMGRPKRAAVRVSFTSLIVLIFAGWLADPWLTSRFVIFVALLLCIIASLAVVFWSVTWRHRRRWVKPLHLRTAALIGVPRAGPMRHIDIARDRSEVRVSLPQGWTADTAGRAEIARTVAETIGIESPDVSWRLAGPAPVLTLTASRPPPARVALADMMPHIRAAKPDEWVWGFGRHDAVVKTSLAGDSPHTGLSMGSGAGKSVTARSKLAQSLFHGAIGLILDYKMISHQWARDLPNVAIARRPHEIHAALLWLGREANRRNEVALAGSDMDGNVHAVVGARLIVVCEELNATVSVLRAYWRQLRNGDKSLPQRSPALDALDLVNFMGRQVLMNLIYMGQRLSVKASGGDGDARESIGVVALGRYSASNWKMLAGDHAMPPKSLTPGRIQVVTDKVQEVQAVFMSAREARELALAGVVTPLPAGMPGRVLVGQHEAISGSEQVVVPGTETRPLRPAGGLVSLREFSENGCSRSLQALRRASNRTGFPDPKGYDGLAKLYDPVELALWDQP